MNLHHNEEKPHHMFGTPLTRKIGAFETPLHVKTRQRGRENK